MSGIFQPLMTSELLGENKRRGAMASDRLAELLLSRGEFTEEEVNRMTEDDAWQWIHASESEPGKPDNVLPNTENN